MDVNRVRLRSRLNRRLARGSVFFVGARFSEHTLVVDFGGRGREWGTAAIVVSDHVDKVSAVAANSFAFVPGLTGRFRVQVLVSDGGVEIWVMWLTAFARSVPSPATGARFWPVVVVFFGLHVGLTVVVGAERPVFGIVDRVDSGGERSDRTGPTLRWLGFELFHENDVGNVLRHRGVVTMSFLDGR
jgi:hypothetical protein